MFFALSFFNSIIKFEKGKIFFEIRFFISNLKTFRVPNIHSNCNQFLLKIELKIAKFQFLIYFSISILNF